MTDPLLVAPPAQRVQDRVMSEARRAAEAARGSVHRGFQFVTSTPTSRYIAAVLSEATHYAGERARQAITAIQVQDPEWSYTDEVVKGERWLTLGWYERQLVEGNDECEAASSRVELTAGLQGPADFRNDGYARWVKDEADSLDEEAGYHVAKLAVVAPAQWQMSNRCAACGDAFSPALHRHHCRLCGRSVCRVHGSRYRSLPVLAAHLGTTSHRVCDECDARMDALATAERAAWRVSRVKLLLRDSSAKLRPYFDVPVDTATNKARRLLRAAVAVARTCPLLAPASATITVEVLEILCKYGPAGLATLVLRREFVEAAELLRRVARVDAAWPLSAHELTAAIYYLLALRRGARGSDPDAERRQFAQCPPCDDATLDELRAAVPAAVWCYLESATAVELVSRQQGYALLFENGWGDGSAVAQPGFICVAKRDPNNESAPKAAILAVRGTASVHDVATDVRAFPAPFPPPPQHDPADPECAWTAVSGTFAFAGMARAAQWLYDETAPALFALAAAGTDIILTGHSLGAGVASLLTVMLRNGLDERGLRNARVKCYGFATPACVDRALAEQAVGLVTSVVLHDDVVPRLTARSLRALMAELLRQRETCMRHWRDDLDAVWGRLRHGLWAPRWRDSCLRDTQQATTQAIGPHPQNASSSTTTRLQPNLATVAAPAQATETPTVNEEEEDADCVAPIDDERASAAIQTDDIETREDSSTVARSDSVGESAPAPEEDSRASTEDQVEDDEFAGALLDELEASEIEDDNASESSDALYIDAVAESRQEISAAAAKRRRARRAAVSAARAAGVAVVSSLENDDDESDDSEDARDDTSSSSDFGTFRECLGTDAPVHDDATHEGDAREDTTRDEPLEHSDYSTRRSASTGDTTSDGRDEEEVEPPEPPRVEQIAEPPPRESPSFSTAAVQTTPLEEPRPPVAAWVSGDDESATFRHSPSYTSRRQLSMDDDDEARFYSEDFDDVDKLPELFVPGRIVHIYSWRGTYEAAFVERDCDALADIVVSANMIRDHSINYYFDAIAEIMDVRRAANQPPPWQPFHATDSCQCCGAKFTWHVTSSSEAQTYREKHNCRSCGLLVCDPCSKRRKPLPSIGLLEPSRVCDRCHYHGLSADRSHPAAAPPAVE